MRGQESSRSGQRHDRWRIAVTGRQNKGGLILAMLPTSVPVPAGRECLARGRGASQPQFVGGLIGDLAYFRSLH